MNRREFMTQTTLAALGAGLAWGQEIPSEASDRMIVSPDWEGDTTPLKHSWAGLVNIDQFRWFVRRDTQEQLKMAHDEIGARHVRAVGMFDDEMRVYANDPRAFRNPQFKGPRTNWQVVDYAIKSLLDIGIHPMFTTCFTPSAIARGEKTTFSTKAHIGMPVDLKEWSALVSKAVQHQLHIWGKSVISQWYYEVWNEPNLSGFFDGTQQEFLDLWAATFRAIKQVDPDLRIGGPSTARAEWISDLIEYGKKNDCVPDYIITHCYNNDSESQPLSPFEGPQEDKISKSPHFISGVVRGTRALLDNLGFKGEIHWNEWGRSWFPYDPVRETAYEAAFTVKTMAEVSQEADYFAYWNLSDIYDQVGYGAQTFHGNYGMLNLQGLRKPFYHAHQLLCRLGTQQVAVRGKGLTRKTRALATKNDKAFQVLVYAYDKDPHHDTGPVRVEISLPVTAAHESLRLYRVTNRENNILHVWKEMGAPDYLRPEELQTLQSANSLNPTRDFLMDGTCAFILDTPGIALLEMDKR